MVGELCEPTSSPSHLSAHLGQLAGGLIFLHTLASAGASHGCEAGMKALAVMVLGTSWISRSVMRKQVPATLI